MPCRRRGHRKLRAAGIPARRRLRRVGEDEADPARGTISRVSPQARALLGHGVGDVVLAGKGEARIQAIR